jgi:uncharacterized protein YutE (UPF0331/DUF86 family)
MIDIDRVLENLTLMIKNLNHLKDFNPLIVENDSDQLKLKKLASERILQLIIRGAIGINHHILRQSFKVKNITDTQSFLLLNKYNILSKELVEQLSKYANFCNVLTFEYIDNDNKIFDLIPKALKQYPLYVLQIQQYLDSLEQNNG